MNRDQLTAASAARLAIMTISILLLVSEDLYSHAQKPSSAQTVLKSAQEILSLSPEAPGSGIPVQLIGVVTQPFEQGIAINDSKTGIWVFCDHNSTYTAGEKVDVRGFTITGEFAPAIRATTVTRLGPGTLPRPRLVTYQELRSGDLDVQYVRIVGRIRAVQVRKPAPSLDGIALKLKVNGGYLMATIPTTRRFDTNKLVDACQTGADDRMIVNNQNSNWTISRGNHCYDSHQSAKRTGFLSRPYDSSFDLGSYPRPKCSNTAIQVSVPRAFSRTASTKCGAIFPCGVLCRANPLCAAQ